MLTAREITLCRVALMLTMLKHPKAIEPDGYNEKKELLIKLDNMRKQLENRGTT